MAYDNFKPQLWNDSILENLDNSLVFGALANKDLKGEIKGYGSSVKNLRGWQRICGLQWHCQL